MRFCHSLRNPLIAVACFLTSSVSYGASESPTGLDQLLHVHGIVGKLTSPNELVVAAHRGLFQAKPDGSVMRISDTSFDVIALTADPAESKRFYASGQSDDKKPLGIMLSNDNGKTWQSIASKGDSDKVFRQLSVSPANPQYLYGLTESIERSTDSGKTWTKVSVAPDNTYRIAASSLDAETVYAATKTGVLLSGDGGKTWRKAGFEGDPVTTIHIGKTGGMLAFVVGKGLMQSQESAIKKTLEWNVLTNELGQQALIDIVRVDAKILYALNHYRKLISSNDGGKNWHRFTGDPVPKSDKEITGAKLFTENCQVCHGKNGVGETFNAHILTDRSYSAAIPLDDSSHAWHHEDDQLVQTILEGGISRGGRMPAWKDKLSKDDAEALVAYIKTLWSDYIRENCQGRKHMQCMQH